LLRCQNAQLRKAQFTACQVANIARHYRTSRYGNRQFNEVIVSLNRKVRPPAKIHFDPFRDRQEVLE